MIFGLPIRLETCTDTNPLSRTWTVVKGGASSENGPAGQIKFHGNGCLDVTVRAHHTGLNSLIPIPLWRTQDGLDNVWEYILGIMPN
jgi:hypothetical protein